MCNIVILIYFNVQSRITVDIRSNLMKWIMRQIQVIFYLSSSTNNVMYTTELACNCCEYDRSSLAATVANRYPLDIRWRNELHLPHLFNQSSSSLVTIEIESRPERYTVLDLRSVAVNAADWKIPTVTSRSLSFPTWNDSKNGSSYIAKRALIGKRI